MEIRADIFKHCMTEEDLQKEWRKVAFELHPDRGGSALKFQRAKELLEKRRAEIESERNMAEKRAKAMRYVGLTGAVMQDIAEGRDFSDNLKKMLPNEWGLGADILNALITKKR